MTRDAARACLKGWAEKNGLMLVETFDVPGAIGTNALRINPQGEIVGFYVDSSGAGRGFLWRRGTFSDIALPGTVLDFANGINARGEIVGQYNDTPGIPQHGYFLNRQGFVAINVPGAVRSTAFDINERGDIVGPYVGANGTTRLYLLSSGVFTTIDVPGTLGTLGTGTAGSLAGINARGDVSAWPDVRGDERPVRHVRDHLVYGRPFLNDDSVAHHCADWLGVADVRRHGARRRRRTHISYHRAAFRRPGHVWGIQP
ncbi:putative extracellular repeat, HAF family [Luteitalea pratensis]|uniref:Putative extracellular repeat, HAF family n=1 Tax=Luteitalea pratensis TaxID=1855912 RepID=A0A143PNH6_LUTPR|nr:hypothetical protein [Luteitalea pratensis]AMY09309.1 putative extracellular repeat, HAF family [Luteitalea pratensis]